MSPSPVAVLKSECISPFPVGRGKIGRGPVGDVLFCGGEKMIRPGFSVAAAGLWRFTPVIAMPGIAKKISCHFQGFLLISTSMAPCGAKGQIGFASFITGQKTNKQHWRNR
jgi:hypothetical protein